ncbi:MAG: AI-2E family transporter [Archangiaceae bacterium]|nr:AI-2E family transporter [Archangiaceae bacterium]
MRLLVAALLTLSLVKLWPEVICLVIALMLAVTFEPLVVRLGRHRLPRAGAVGLITFAGVVVIGAFFFLVVPPMASQLLDLGEKLPDLMKQAKGVMPKNNPLFNGLVDQAFLAPTSPQFKEQLGKVLIWGQSALSGLLTGAIVLVVAIYFLLDGRRLYAWLLAFVPRHHREKMAQTVDGVNEVIYAYVRGQALTSVLFAVFVGIVLAIFKVPSVLPLAVLAAICDVVPVVGIIVATLPAVLLALTVSPSAAAAVGGLYLGYHLFETYVLVPRLYGKMMRLSTLTVLLALIIGGALQGVVGAVLALPLVAAYPIVERIWLQRFFRDEVLEDHAALDQVDEKTKSDADPTVEKVLHPEKPPTGPAPH